MPPEKTVFISGIGCAGRFVYYMDTYGMHGIHGRAPALATGIATSRDDLSVWVVSGDGDSLSIGGNHLIHALRRNVPIKLLLFNNQIYGLTKGQYSPTSEKGKITKSTPFGSEDQPFNPLALALGAEASFVARTIDVEKKHVAATSCAPPPSTRARPSSRSTRTATSSTTAPSTRSAARAARPNQIRLEHGEPIRFGADDERGVDPRRRRQPRPSPTSPRSARTRSSSTTPTVEDPSYATALARLAEQPHRADPDRRPARRQAAGLRRRAPAGAGAPPTPAHRSPTSTSCCAPATPGPSPSTPVRLTGSAGTWRPA